jgi:hypothetical protein
MHVVGTNQLRRGATNPIEPHSMRLAGDLNPRETKQTFVRIVDWLVARNSSNPTVTASKTPAKQEFSR